MLWLYDPKTSMSRSWLLALTHVGSIRTARVKEVLNAKLRPGELTEDFIRIITSTVERCLPGHELVIRERPPYRNDLLRDLNKRLFRGCGTKLQCNAANSCHAWSVLIFIL